MGIVLSEEEESFFSFGEQTSENEKILQLTKYRDICEYLLSAGYFRVRNRSLSPFDKIVGGLCWSILASGEEVDVDLFYSENLTIGQQIRLCENIIRVLRAMGCLHPLQAHQIRGYDMKAMFPVVQFLVRRVISKRAAVEEKVRLFSEMSFDSEEHTFGPLPYPMEGMFSTKSKAVYNSLADKYKAERMYKVAKKGVNRDEVGDVQRVLLEYGEKLGSFHTDVETGGDEGDETFIKEAQQAEIERAKQLEAQQRDLLQGLAKVGGLSGSQVAGFLGLQSELIKEEIRTHAEAEEKRLEEMGKLDTKRGIEAAHQRQVQALLRQLAQHEKEYKKLESACAKAKATLDKKSTEKNKALKKKNRLIKESEALTKIEQESDNKDKIAKLKSLVNLNESLKIQEKSFKQHCTKRRDDLTAEIDRLKGIINGTSANSEEMSRLKEIENMYEQISGKYRKLRQLLAKKTRAVNSVSRKIDDIPTRKELLQYERRFGELYEEVATKLEETRKHYNTFNTLTKTHNFMGKEVSFLQSINDGFRDAMATRGGKKPFLDGLIDINKVSVSSVLLCCCTICISNILLFIFLSF